MYIPFISRLSVGACLIEEILIQYASVWMKPGKPLYLVNNDNQKHIGWVFFIRLKMATAWITAVIWTHCFDSLLSVNFAAWQFINKGTILFMMIIERIF